MVVTPNAFILRTLLIFSLMDVVSLHVAKGSSTLWPEYLQQFWFLQSTCKPHKSLHMVNMIMSLYYCKFHFHDSKTKHNDLCTNNVFLILPLFVVPSCIYPMIAMIWCFLVSYPRLFGQLVMDDEIYVFLYHLHFGLHDFKNNHVNPNHRWHRILEQFWFFVHCKYGCEPFWSTITHTVAFDPNLA